MVGWRAVILDCGGRSCDDRGVMDEMWEWAYCRTRICGYDALTPGLGWSATCRLLRALHSSISWRRTILVVIVNNSTVPLLWACLSPQLWQTDVKTFASYLAGSPKGSCWLSQFLILPSHLPFLQTPVTRHNKLVHDRWSLFDDDVCSNHQI